MKIQDISQRKCFREAPEEGHLLAYARDKVIFEKYSSLSQAEEWLKDKDILELHLFDREKEYRCLSSTSRRFAGQGGIIDLVESFEDDPVSVYRDQTRLENRKEILTVLNHITYDEEQGMAEVDSYRLIAEEGKEKK